APRFGETLPPDAKPLLHRLGVWEAVHKDAHLPSPGITSVWGSEEPYENDYIFNPYGNGWHLDRTRFDRTLMDVAEQAGAEVFRGAHVLACTRTEEAQWSVTFEDAGGQRAIDAAFAIEATGRSAW